MPDRHGSLLGCAPLGTAVSGIQPHGQTDGSEVRHPLPFERQARQEPDAADAAAICEAVTRPNMRFVPVKGKSISKSSSLWVTTVPGKVLRRRAYRYLQPAAWSDL